MSFPNIQFKTTNTHTDTHLQDVVIHKFKSFERYIGSATDLTCQVEFEKVGVHNNGPIYRVEANFYRDGQLFRAEATEDSFEKAIDVVRGELDAELNRAFKKRETLMKRGGRAIKDLLRFGR